MGRRKTLERKTNCIRAYLTDAEMQRVLMLSQAMGLNVSILIKRRLLIPHQIIIDGAKLLTQLHFIAEQIIGVSARLEDLSVSGKQGLAACGECLKAIMEKYFEHIAALEKTLREMLIRLDHKNK